MILKNTCSSTSGLIVFLTVTGVVSLLTSGLGDTEVLLKFHNKTRSQKAVNILIKAYLKFLGELSNISLLGISSSSTLTRDLDIGARIKDCPKI